MIVALVGTIALGLSVGAILAARANAAADPESERAAIQNLFVAAAQKRGDAARTFDTSAFVQIFADDPATPLTLAQQAALAELSPGTQPKGFLTYMTAYFAHWRDGADAFRRVQAAVKAGAQPAAADVRAAIPPRVDPNVLPSFVFKNLALVGTDHAYVDIEAPGLLFKVTLVRQGTRWLVAGETTSQR